jgi:hypothetical protein
MVARLTVGAALFALATVAQAAVEKGTAKVVAVHGGVELSTDGSSWAPVKRGQNLREGAVIRTTGTSAVDLDLGRNGSNLRLLPNTTVALAALTYEETGVETIVNTQIDLRAGRVLGHVQKLSAASKYEVRTPKVVAGIRGTRYDISAEGKVVVAEGSVVVVAYRDDGSTITRVVNANEVFTPASGVVTPATEADLGDVGGSASSVAGIASLPPLEGAFFDDRTAIDRVVLPTDVFVSRTQPKDQPSGTTPPPTGGE